jgi:hypothetical protein
MATVSRASLPSETPTVQNDTANADPKKVADPTYKTDFGIIPIPRHLRYDPERPFHFGLFLNAFFGFASTFIVSNLYFCQVYIPTSYFTLADPMHFL